MPFSSWGLPQHDIKLDWKETEAKASRGERKEVDFREERQWPGTERQVASYPPSSAAPPAVGEGVPAMQFQREMRNGSRRHTGGKESGGHPEKAGMRTRDRDESHTHTHTDTHAHTKLPPKAAETLQKAPQPNFSGFSRLHHQPLWDLPSERN